jgi:hypothetical protein
MPIILIAILAFSGVSLAGESEGGVRDARRDLLKLDAERAFASGNYKEAIRFSNEFLDLHEPRILGLSTDVAFWLGVSHLRNKNYIEAQKNLSKIIEQLDPDYADAYVYMAEVHANSMLKIQMKNDLLKAAELGYDVIRFAEKTSTEEEVKKLAKDATFILEVLNKEKFEFKEPDHDPFHVPLKKPVAADATHRREEVKQVQPYTHKKQEDNVREAWRLWNELKILMDKVEKEQTEVPELMTYYEKIRNIISEKEMERYTNIDLQAQLRRLKGLIESQDVKEKLRWVRQKIFRKMGENMLKKMLYHLNRGEYVDVYDWHLKLTGHVVNPQYVEFKEEGKWLTKQAAIIFDKAKIRERFIKLDLQISGTVILDQGRQEVYRRRLEELEKKLEDMTSRMWADISQNDIEEVERMIKYYRDKIRPQFVIINDRPYEKGHPIHGQEDLTLVDMDEKFAYFKFMGEDVKKALPKIMSPTSVKRTQGRK